MSMAKVKSKARLAVEALNVGAVFTGLAWLCSFLPPDLEGPEPGTAFEPVKVFILSSLVAFLVLWHLDKCRRRKLGRDEDIRVNNDGRP